MKAKNRQSGGVLFNKLDEKNILSWPDNTAKYVWNRIHDNIMLLGYHGIGRELCPFCIHHRLILYGGGCRSCAWGANHGDCGNSDSDVYRVANKEKFTNEFYKKIIRSAR